MALNETDSIYGTGAQVEFARKMAEALLKPRQTMTGDMLKSPGAWMLTVPDVLHAISGAQYRDIAGSQDKNLTTRAVTGDPNYKTPGVTYGTPIQRKPTVIDPTKGPGGDKVGVTTPTEDVDIADGVDPNAPYMSRPRDIKGLSRIVMHGDVQEDADRLLQYGRRVDKIRGFDPNYHYYIARDGKVTQGVPDDKVANHAKGHNTDTIGIVLAGADAGKEPTAEQKASAIKLSAKLAQKYGIKQENVFGHGELDPKRRDPREAGDVAATIRKNGFVPPAMALGASDVVPAAASPASGTMSMTKFAGHTPKTDVTAAREPGRLPSREENPDQSIETAQVYQSKPAAPARDGIIDIPGYRGPAPVVPYVESMDHILSKALAAGNPEQMQEILADYQKRLQPIETKVPNGRLVSTPVPGGGQPTVRFIPEGETEPGKIAPKFGTDGKLGYELKVPGVDGNSYTNTPSDPNKSPYENFITWKQRMEAQGKAIDEKTMGLAKKQTEIVDQASSSPEQLRGLQAIQALSKSLDLSRGITKDAVLAAKGVVDNISPGLSGMLGIKEGMAGSELVEKLNMAMAMAATRTITSRGTNFDIQTNMRTNPGLFQSKAGTELLVDVLQQEHKAKMEIGKLVNKLKPEELDRIPDVITDYYDKNPVLLKYPDGRKVTVHQITDDDKGIAFYNKLPKGMGYINLNGEVAYKK